MGEGLILLNLTNLLLNIRNSSRIKEVESDIDKIVNKYNITDDNIRYALELSLKKSNDSTAYLDSLFLNLTKQLNEREAEVARLNNASLELQASLDRLSPDAKLALYEIYPLLSNIQDFLEKDLDIFKELYNMDNAIVADLKEFQADTLFIMDIFNLKMSDVSSYMVNTDKIIMDLSNELFMLRASLNSDIKEMETDIQSITAETNRVLKDLKLISNNDSAVLVNNKIILSNSSIVRYPSLSSVQLQIAPRSMDYTYKVNRTTRTATYTGPIWTIGHKMLYDNIVSNPESLYSAQLNQISGSELSILLPRINLTGKFYVAIRTEAASVLAKSAFSCTFITRKLKRHVDIYRSDWISDPNASDGGYQVSTYVRTDVFDHEILDEEYNHFIYPSSVGGITRPKLIEVKNIAVAPGLAVLEIGFVTDAPSVLATQNSIPYPSWFHRKLPGNLVIGRKDTIESESGDLVLKFPSLPITITGIATFTN